LGAWLNGRTALLLDPQLPADQMRRALAQEGCTSLNA